MDNLEQTEKADAPIGFAAFACLVCFAVIWWLTSFVGRHFNIAWVIWPISIVSSLSVTFFILYRSAWHRELPTITRVLSMLLSSVIIFLAAFLFAGLMFTGVCIVMNLHFSNG